MKLKILWGGYQRRWRLVNGGGQTIRENFESYRAAEDWAKLEGYEVIW